MVEPTPSPPNPPLEGEGLKASAFLESKESAGMGIAQKTLPFKEAVAKGHTSSLRAPRSASSCAQSQDAEPKDSATTLRFAQDDDVWASATASLAGKAKAEEIFDRTILCAWLPWLSTL
jgi:hypothetical protein